MAIVVETCYPFRVIVLSKISIDKIIITKYIVSRCFASVAWVYRQIKRFEVSEMDQILSKFFFKINE